MLNTNQYLLPQVAIFLLHQIRIRDENLYFPVFQHPIYKYDNIRAKLGKDCIGLFCSVDSGGQHRFK